MEKLNQFIIKRSRLIPIILLTVSIAMFFIPCVYFTENYAFFNSNSASPFLILKDNVEFIIDVKEALENPEPSFAIDGKVDAAFIWENAKTSIIYLIFFFTLWILLLISIFISKKHPYFFLWSLIPLSVISVYCFYMVIGWATYYQPPHIGVFIYAAVFIFELLCFAALMHKLIKSLPPSKPRPRKPTKSERIAELEARLAKLEEQDKTTSE